MVTGVQTCALPISLAFLEGTLLAEIIKLLELAAAMRAIKAERDRTGRTAMFDVADDRKCLGGTTRTD